LTDQLEGRHLRRGITFNVVTHLYTIAMPLVYIQAIILRQSHIAIDLLKGPTWEECIADWLAFVKLFRISQLGIYFCLSSQQSMRNYWSQIWDLNAITYFFNYFVICQTLNKYASVYKCIYEALKLDLILGRINWILLLFSLFCHFSFIYFWKKKKTFNITNEILWILEGNLN
jgi:hypothetical protein